VVIGGGAAGMAAATAAAGRGARVLLVQDGPIGGECTFTGCVPSKTLLAAAARGDPFDKAMGRVRAAVERIAQADDALVRRQGVEVVDARARFLAPGRLEVGGAVVPARRVVVATGGRPVIPPIPGLDRAAPLTNETVFALGARPRSLFVLGGGPVGCELAQAFRRLGSEVTVLELRERLLAAEEPEASTVVARAFAAEGIDVRLGCGAERVEPDGDRALVTLAGGGTLTAERVLVAAGRRPATGDLDLGAAGVELDEGGFVRTDDRMATTAPGVWAAGDVTGRMPFTHAADEMGRIAALNALSRRARRRLRADAIPWVTFTDPEVARVGLAEADAGPGARVAYLPMDEVDRAVAAGETLGFVKIVAGPRRLLRHAGGGRVLGATVVAPRAGELIHEAAIAIRTGMFAGRLAQTVHAYPTWSVAMRQAAAQLVTEVGGRRARPAAREPR